MDKKDLRSRMLAVRDSIGSGQRQRLSELVVGRLLESDWYRQSRIVFSYLAVGSEVDTAGLCARVLGDTRKMLCVPRCGPGKGRMEAVAVETLEGLTSNRWGIPEPDRSCAAVPPERIDLVVVPGICFNRQGFRIGYGGGFYDRYLGGAGLQAVTVGMAFCLQVIGEKFDLSFDIPVNYICTENGFVSGSLPGEGNE